MKYSFALVKFFMSSFSRRNFSETASCITKNFIFQTPIIEVKGRDKFIKLQQKIDSNFFLVVTNLEADRESNVFNLQYTYHIHLHARPKIEIKAHSKIYLPDKLISKMVVEFEDPKQAENVFKQMIYH